MPERERSKPEGLKEEGGWTNRLDGSAGITTTNPIGGGARRRRVPRKIQQSHFWELDFIPVFSVVWNCG